MSVNCLHPTHSSDFVASDCDFTISDKRKILSLAAMRIFVQLICAVEEYFQLTVANIAIAGD